jgi:hypothetical protein
VTQEHRVVVRLVLLLRRVAGCAHLLQLPVDVRGIADQVWIRSEALAIVITLPATARHRHIRLKLHALQQRSIVYSSLEPVKLVDRRLHVFHLLAQISGPLHQIVDRVLDVWILIVDLKVVLLLYMREGLISHLSVRILRILQLLQQVLVLPDLFIMAL